MKNRDDGGGRRSPSSASWADLPQELSGKIAESLESTLDLSRFRAVCGSWRSSVSPSPSHQRFPPIKAFFSEHHYFCLSEATICRVQPSDGDKSSTSSSSSSSSSSSGSGSWLAKIEEAVGGMKVSVPLPNCRARNPPGMSLNALNFRFVEITKSYTLKEGQGVCFYPSKVLVFPGSDGHNSDDESVGYGVLALSRGKLRYYRFREQKWRRVVDIQTCYYEDIAVYKGELYVVDERGVVSRIGPSLQLIRCSSPINNSGDKKNLVESSGGLYIVDRYLDGRWQIYDDSDADVEYVDYLREYRDERAKTVDIKVYKLDENTSTWVRVWSLGDQIFVLSKKCCFSVSAKEFSGCQGNYIYFTDPDPGELFDSGAEVKGHKTCVFNVAADSIGKIKIVPSYCQIFRPPFLT